MEYNSTRNRLVIPEYGRNIQKMIEYAITIENREERNSAAKAIVAVMGYLNPQLQNITDFKHKLWDHLFVISDFKLSVDSPYPIPNKDTFKSKPQRVPYPNNKIKYKYYGVNMETMIAKIAALEDGQRKEQITQNIANFMKMSYLTWNKDTVDDTTILGHLEQLSGAKLKLSETAKLNHTNELLVLSKEKERERERERKINRGGGRNNKNNNNNRRRKK
jgi:hypothetical protein